MTRHAAAGGVGEAKEDDRADLRCALSSHRFEIAVRCASRRARRWLIHSLLSAFLEPA